MLDARQLAPTKMRAIHHLLFFFALADQLFPP